MGYKPKAPAVMSDINVIPMADIMLVLLIIFMVVTPMLQKGMNVDLAPVENPKDLPDADKDDAILIAVISHDFADETSRTGLSAPRRTAGLVAETNWNWTDSRRCTTGSRSRMTSPGT